MPRRRIRIAPGLLPVSASLPIPYRSSACGLSSDIRIWPSPRGLTRDNKPSHRLHVLRGLHCNLQSQRPHQWRPNALLARIAVLLHMVDQFSCRLRASFHCRLTWPERCPCRFTLSVAGALICAAPHPALARLAALITVPRPYLSGAAVA